MTSKDRTRRGVLASIAVLTLVLLFSLVALSSAGAASKAAFTTVNEHADGAGHCQNGNPNVNCNIYDGAEFVWLNGGPVNAALGDGRYVFAVVSPGGQSDPNDGSPDLLSTDAYTNRVFSVSNGVVSYSGTHSFDSNEIRLVPFRLTPNPGGEYKLAICSLDSGVPVVPRDCKYDAFKVKAGDLTDETSTSTTTTSTSTTTTTFHS